MEGGNKNRKRARGKGNGSGSKGNNGVMEQQKRRKLQIELEDCGEKIEGLYSGGKTLSPDHRTWWGKKPGKMLDGNKKCKIFAGFSSGATSVWPGFLLSILDQSTKKSTSRGKRWHITVGLLGLVSVDEGLSRSFWPLSLWLILTHTHLWFHSQRLLYMSEKHTNAKYALCGVTEV